MRAGLHGISRLSRLLALEVSRAAARRWRRCTTAPTAYDSREPDGTSSSGCGPAIWRASPIRRRALGLGLSGRDREPDGPVPVQLMSRLWRITDGRGRVEEVRGPGVVGEQPVIAPGEQLCLCLGLSADDAVGRDGRRLCDGRRRRAAASRRRSRPSAWMCRATAGAELSRRVADTREASSRRVASGSRRGSRGCVNPDNRSPAPSSPARRTRRGGGGSLGAIVTVLGCSGGAC